MESTLSKGNINLARCVVIQNIFDKTNLAKRKQNPLIVPFSNVLHCLFIETTTIVDYANVKRPIEFDLDDLALSVNGIFNLNFTTELLSEFLWIDAKFEQIMNDLPVRRRHLIH